MEYHVGFHVGDLGIQEIRYVVEEMVDVVKCVEVRMGDGGGYVVSCVDDFRVHGAVVVEEITNGRYDVAMLGWH